MVKNNVCVGGDIKWGKKSALVDSLYLHQIYMHEYADCLPLV